MNKYQEALNDIIKSNSNFVTKNDSYYLMQELVDMFKAMTDAEFIELKKAFL